MKSEYRIKKHFETRRHGFLFYAVGLLLICFPGVAAYANADKDQKPAGKFWPEMPVPEDFNYDMWLGSTPPRFYTENCVHPQDSYDRPGWLRLRQFGAGMINGWGAHHLDIAHWGMGTELTGPIEAECVNVKFPTSGLWDVLSDSLTEQTIPFRVVNFRE